MEKTANNKAPIIFEYHDYRVYLKDAIAHRQATSTSFSMRQFARRAGFEAHNYLSLVMRGQRNLSVASIRKVAKGLGLRKDEAEYFENMVHMNQAISSEEKNHFYKRMSSSKKYLEVHHVTHDQYEFYSKWHYTVVRELVSLPNFREDPAWIAKKVKPAITPAEAAAAIELLLRLGMVARGEDGRLTQTTPHLSTPSQVAFLGVANFHKEMIARAHESIDRVSSKQRDVSSITVALPPSRVEMAKEKIAAFRRELHALLAAPVEDDEHAIYQINFQLFSLSEVGNA